MQTAITENVTDTMTTIDRAPVPSLGANLAIFIAAPVVLNGVIFRLHWDRPRAETPGIPPGWLVGSLWVGLFAAMGAARWLLLRRSISRRLLPIPEGVTLLAFLSLLYPLYTRGFRNNRVGLAGNAITAGVAAAVAVPAWRRSRAATACLAAVGAWLLYAGAATAYGLCRDCRSVRDRRP